MQLSSSTSSTPSHVVLGRHLVAVAAVILATNTFLEGDALPSAAYYLGQLVVVLTAGLILGGVATLFSKDRGAAAFMRHVAVACWIVALISLIPIIVEKVALSDANVSSTSEDFPRNPDGKYYITIEALRKRYPEKLGGLTDLEIARLVHKTVAPETPFEEFAATLGVKTE